MRFFHRIPAFIMVYHKLFFDRFQYLYQIPANFTYQICPNLLSLPVRERGLKPYLPISGAAFEDVAPRAGAWIEIQIIEVTKSINASLPVRERGLKY